jgi:hypothetical protein
MGALFMQRPTVNGAPSSLLPDAVHAEPVLLREAPMGGSAEGQLSKGPGGWSIVVSTAITRVMNAEACAVGIGSGQAWHSLKGVNSLRETNFLFCESTLTHATNTLTHSHTHTPTRHTPTHTTSPPPITKFSSPCHWQCGQPRQPAGQP